MHIKTVREDMHRQRYPHNKIANIAVAAMPPDNAHHMGRPVQNAAKLAISEWCAEVEEPGLCTRWSKKQSQTMMGKTTLNQ